MAKMIKTQNLLKKAWYKWLGIALVLYSLLAGLGIPLAPGIESIQADHIEVPGPYRLTCIGYNTNFLEAESSMQSWLRRGEFYLCPDSIIVGEQERAELFFSIPDGFLSDEQRHYTVDLIVNNDLDGNIAFRNTIVAKQLIPSSLVGNEVPECSRTVNTKTTEGISFPNREILYESIRNLFFHVPMWFSMILLFLLSAVASISYLRNYSAAADELSASLAEVGLVLGVLATLTGMLWAQYAWGKAWSGDVKQNMAAICLMIYFAYLVLRRSIDDQNLRARASSVYNIFAFVACIALLFVVPRTQSSLHPGSGGNPGFDTYDLDGLMRMVFYPAVLGWTLVAVWIASLLFRMRQLRTVED